MKQLAGGKTKTQTRSYRSGQAAHANEPKINVFVKDLTEQMTISISRVSKFAFDNKENIHVL